MLQTLTDIVAFDGAEHAEGLNQPAAVLQQAVQETTGTKLMERQRKAVTYRVNTPPVYHHPNLFPGWLLTDKKFFMAITKQV